MVTSVAPWAIFRGAELSIRPNGDVHPMTFASIISALLSGLLPLLLQIILSLFTGGTVT
jgi:hypothetical protein